MNPRFRSGGFTYIYSGNYARAYELFDLDGDSAFGQAGKGLSLTLLGEKARAVELFDRAIALEPNSFTGMLQVAMKAYVLDKKESALQALRDVEVAKSADTDSEHCYFIASVYGALGDHASCARMLRKAVSGGFFSHPAMLIDPFLDPVRDDPEVREVLMLAKEKHEAFRKKHFPGAATSGP